MTRNEILDLLNHANQVHGMPRGKARAIASAEIQEQLELTDYEKPIDVLYVKWWQTGAIVNIYWLDRFDNLINGEKHE
jgi:hypothetical protein